MQCQKRPFICANETHYVRKRDLLPWLMLSCCWQESMAASGFVNTHTSVHARARLMSCASAAMCTPRVSKETYHMANEPY